MKSAAMAGLLVAASLLVDGAWADTIPNDKENYQGDVLVSKTRFWGYYNDAPPGAVVAGAVADKKFVCIGAGTKFQRTGAFEDGTPTKKYMVIRILRKDEKTCDDGAVLPSDRLIYVDEQDYGRTVRNRYGLTFGGLVIPFKYQFQGSRTVQAGGAVGGYLGIRLDSDVWGVELKPIVFVGGGVVNVEQSVNGTAQTQSLAGLSYGLGLVGSIKDSFQLGLVVGKDRVGKSAGYVDDGKWWLALSFGTSFYD